MNGKSGINGKRGKKYLNITLMFGILEQITQGPCCSKDIADKLQVSRIIILNTIKTMRNCLMMEIYWQQDYSLPSKGFFVIEDWGLINPNKLPFSLGNLLPNATNSLDTQ